jgi:hypothetical protein
VYAICIIAPKSSTLRIREAGIFCSESRGGIRGLF